MKGLYLKGVVVVFFLLAWATQLQATHLRAGEITLRRESCTSLTFRITINIYTDTGSPIRFGDGILNFGDGSTPLITPTIDNTTRTDLGPEVGFVTFTTTHTFPGPGRFVISYLEANRNANVLNMSNSVNTTFYIETEIRIDPFLGCNNTPILLIAPIDKGCTGAAFEHNPGAVDSDGDSLSYELAIPKRDKDVVVNGYLDPNNRVFYDRVGLNYPTANEAVNGPPTFSIDKNGTLKWDAPGAPGEYNIAFIIKEWRKINNVWIQLGYVVRDMQIIIDDCLNKRPELQVPPDICVEAGTTITQDIFETDPDFNDVKIEAFSEAFLVNPSPATLITPATADQNGFQDIGPGVNAKVTFNWVTHCNHVKDQPYQVVFKITDRSNSGPSLVSFKTWNIRIVGPAPEWETATVNLSTRSVNLDWKNYECAQKADRMEVWRRVDQFPFTPPECVTGMPDFLGYTKIAEVPIGTTAYLDNNGGSGLAVGAQYCYRLVALFPQPGGGESYVSQEICVPPIEATAPIITNVTVDVTSTTAGKITVRWTPPYDANPAQFPPPYTYEVQRAEGFTGNNGLVLATPGRIADTVFLDDDALNTRDKIYNYRITAYASNNNRVDVSSVASTVRLETVPKFLQIDLNWSASVPWSNQIETFPMHRIYRGPEGSTEATLVLIDSVNVNLAGLTYSDLGQFNGVPLQETQTYCYRVMTRGAYGNPRVKEPLINFSQIICDEPNDEVAPCKPEFEIEARDCSEYQETASCGNNIYSNTITWKSPTGTCEDDIRGYKIFKADKADGTFTELNIPLVLDNLYVDENLPSFAACYKIVAVDRAGNESEPSEPFCFDNCPYYELPNVFTPNGDNCNDLFGAFRERIVDENNVGPCGEVDIIDMKRRCARFVQKVNFTVFNRWGKEVFTYESGGERSIYIDWDGRDNGGKEVSGGTYFYSADVTFDVVDPSQKTRTIRGWVQIIR